MTYAPQCGPQVVPLSRLKVEHKVIRENSHPLIRSLGTSLTVHQYVTDCVTHELLINLLVFISSMTVHRSMILS